MADRDVRVRLSASVANYIAGMQAAAAATDRVTASGVNLNKLGGTLQGIGRTMTMGVTAPLAAAGGAAVVMSNRFNTSFTRMTTLAGMSTREIGGMRDAVLSLSKQTGRGPQELADALYNASSSGLDARQSLDAVTIAAKGAASGLGSSGDIISLVASATNSYGAEVMDAAKATDILVGTIREGRADPDELAGSLGRILPTAAALGVSFEEVGGTVAFLSNVFGDTDRTITSLGDAFAKLQSPTDQGRAALAQYGSSMEELHAIIAEDGLLGAMQHLKEIGLSDDPLAFRAVFEDQNARQGALAMIANLEGLESAIDGVKNSSGALEGAWQAAQGEEGFKMAQAWAEIQVALVEFGDAIGPIAADIATGVGQIASAFASLPDGVQMAIAGVLIALGPMAYIAGTFMKHAQTIAAARALMAGTPFIGPIGPLGQGVRFGAIPTAAVIAQAYQSSSDTRTWDGRETWINPNTGRREVRPGQSGPENGVIHDFITRDVQRGGANLVPERLGIPQTGYATPTVGHGDFVGVDNRATSQAQIIQDAVTAQRRAQASAARQARNQAQLGGLTPYGRDADFVAEINEIVRAGQAAAVTANLNRDAMVRVVTAQDEWVNSINRTIDVAAEQYAEFQRLKAITDEYALATASTDWGAASFAAANTAMREYTSEAFGLVNIQMAQEEAYDRLNKAIEDNGFTLDVSTEAGRENMVALQGVASVLDTQFVSAYDAANGSQEAFMRTATKIGEQTLTRLQSELGLTDEQTALLADTLNLTASDYTARFKLTGDEEARIRLGLLSGVIGLLQEDVQREVAMKIATGDFQGALDTVQANIADTPKKVPVTITAIDNATGTIGRIAGALFNLKDKTVTVRAKQVGSVGVKMKAMGGYVDGPEFAMIGEAGPEVVLPLSRPDRMRQLLTDPRVMSPLSAAMAGNGGSGGGAASVASLSPSFDVRVFVGNREITDIVRTEFKQRDDRQLAGARFG